MATTLCHWLIFNFEAKRHNIWHEVFQAMEAGEEYFYDTGLLHIRLYMNDLPDCEETLRDWERAFQEKFDIDASVTGWSHALNPVKEVSHGVYLSASTVALTKMEEKMITPEFVGFLKDQNILRIEGGDVEMDIRNIHMENFTKTYEMSMELEEKNRKRRERKDQLGAAWKNKNKPVINRYSYGHSSYEI